MLRFLYLVGELLMSLIDSCNLITRGGESNLFPVVKTHKRFGTYTTTGVDGVRRSDTVKVVTRHTLFSLRSRNPSRDFPVFVSSVQSEERMRTSCLESRRGRGSVCLDMVEVLSWTGETTRSLN